MELRLVRESELAFVHLFDLQICFVGVFPTRQDLDDNVNSLVFIYQSSLEVFFSKNLFACLQVLASSVLLLRVASSCLHIM